ncbi:MAG: AAA family ATPase [Intrasporangium sp.]|uniref:BTAD domain-containing putative transcriptional regulator n=1 Tax=Intrasporangium sp. TaxID=1925024 RepID=UPI002648D626|nr:BTAD domain-containing putative transcriptional regulator [Intrasporangium sp.]MDN5795351.1 AAA family ATPase [Intrasporangium sp.]
MVLIVRLLGEVQACRDGVRLEVPAGKTSELLARLALDAGVRVRADALLEELWAEPAGRNTLQSKVSQLRGALGDKDLVVGSAEGYLLAVPKEAVDATRATDLASASSTARAAGNAAASLEQALEGLALFRGDVLLEMGDWAGPHRARLEEVRLGLIEDAIAARVDLGAGGDVVGELEMLVGQHPLREGLWVSLITALYRAGRQAEALATYRRVRRALREELAIQPGTALRRLEQQVLRQSVQLTGRAHAVALPGNLPTAPDTLVGREKECAAVADAVDRHRLVIVVGPAGVGKTRLAVEVAAQLTAPGGVWLVRLDAVDATSRLAQVVAETMHVHGGEPALRERLAGSDSVLLLDNCEHLVVEAAALAEWLMDAVPTLRLLATSQVPLGVEGEHVHHLAPLTQEDSVALFAARAREARRQLALDDETSEVIEQVCTSLDGLPLAIELAAARVRSLSVREISRRLHDRFALLRDPTSRRPERRRALEAAIEWSYHLLFPDDQRALMALARFAGSGSLSALEHVSAVLGVPAAAVLDTVGRLVDRSLVIVDEGEGGEVRYRLLDSIRAYAVERLLESGQAEACAAAHARWYAAAAAWCDEHVRSSRQPECLAVARAERANVDLALAWCAEHDPGLGTRIATGFGWTWVVLGDGPAGATRVRNALHDEAAAAERAYGCLLAGWLEASAGNVELARDDLDAARALLESLDDEVLLADADRHQAFLAIQQGRPGVVLETANASLATYRARSLSWRTAGSLLLAAYGSLMLGDTGTAARDAAEAVEILEPIGDSWCMVHGEAILGGIAQAEGRLEEAAVALERAADKSQLMGFRGQAALHRATLGRIQDRLGDATAIASYERAIADAVAVGDGRLTATARLNLARCLRRHDEPDRAMALLVENDRWYRSAGGGDFALLTACLLASMREDETLLLKVLEQARSDTNLEVQIHALDALARLAAQRADTDRAAALLADADELAPDIGHLVDRQDRIDAEFARRLST